MIHRRLREYRDRVQAELETAFGEDHTPHELAISFAIGVFITALPTLGTGILLFFVILHVFNWMNKLAMFAAIVVLNPLVKPAVYLASYQVGSFVLGPQVLPTDEFNVVGTTVGATRLLIVGNLFVATLLSAVGYVLVRRLAVEYRRRNFQVAEVVFNQ